MESRLITWPDGPDIPPPEVPLQNGIIFSRTEKGLEGTAIGYGSEQDTPQGRFRRGHAGMLVLERSFGRLRQGDTTTDDIEASERYRVLAREASALLDKKPYALSAETMQ